MEIKQMLQLDTKQYKKALRDIENYTRKETKKLRTLLGSLSIDIDKKGLKKDLNSVKRDINKFKKDAGKIKVNIDADTSKPVGKLSSLGNSLHKFGNAVSGLKHGADIINGLTSSYFEFEESLGNAQKTMQISSEETGKYGEQLTNLSGDVGITAAEMTGAWTGIMQSGVEAGDALDILEVSSVAAATGMGETAEVSTALTEALQASGAGFDEAGRYADVFSAALGSSKLTLPELSGAMNQLMPAAKKAGVSIESVSASLVSMSKQGKTAPQAMGELGAVMKELKNPSAELKAAMEKADVSMKSIKTDGLQANLQKLAESTGGGTKGFTELFRTAEAGSGALSLTGTNAVSAAEDFNTMQSSMGGVNKSFEELQNNSTFQLQAVKSQLQATLIDSFRLLAPYILDMLKAVNGLLGGFNNMTSAGKGLSIILGLIAAWYIKTIGLSKLKILADMGVAASSTGAAGAQGILAIATGKAAAAMLVFLTSIGPIGWILMGIAGAAALVGVAFAAFGDEEEEAAEKTEKLTNAQKKQQEQLESTSKTLDGIKGDRMVKLTIDGEDMLVTADEARKRINEIKQDAEDLENEPVEIQIDVSVNVDNERKARIAEISKKYELQAIEDKRARKIRELEMEKEAQLTELEALKDTTGLKEKVEADFSKKIQAIRDEMNAETQKKNKAYLQERLSGLDKQLKNEEISYGVYLQEIDKIYAEMGRLRVDDAKLEEDLAKKKQAVIDKKEAAEAAYYEEMKFKDAGYTDWKKGKIAEELDEKRKAHEDSLLMMLNEGTITQQAYNEKLAALKEYYEEKKRLANEALEEEESADDEKKKQEKLAADQAYYDEVKFRDENYYAWKLGQIEAEKAAEEQKQMDLWQAQVEAGEMDAADMQSRIENLKAQNAEEIALEKAKLDEGLQLFRENEKAKADAEAEAGKMKFDYNKIPKSNWRTVDAAAHVAYLNKMLDDETLTADQRAQIEEELAEKKKEVNQSAMDDMKRGLTEGLDALSGYYDGQLEKIDSQKQAKLEKLDEEEAEELAKLDNLQLSREEKEKRKEAIEKKYRTKKEKAEKEALEKERAIKKKQQKIQAAQALMSTYESAVKAYNSLAGIPFIGHALGIAAAAFAISTGLSNVDQILSQKFASGGFTGDGYLRDGTGERVAGVVHENEFVFEKSIVRNNLGELFALRSMMQSGVPLSSLLNPAIRVPSVAIVRRHSFADGGYAAAAMTTGGGYDFRRIEKRLESIEYTLHNIEPVTNVYNNLETDAVKLATEVRYGEKELEASTW